MLDYSPLWETLEKQGKSQYILIDNGIDKRTMDQLRHNRNVTALTLEKICRILNCTPNNVLTFKDDVQEIIAFLDQKSRGYCLCCLHEPCKCRTTQ